MQHTVRGILLLVALVAPAQAQPALNTCEGARDGFLALNSACSAQACGNTCATAISSIDDNTLSLVVTGFTATTLITNITQPSLHTKYQDL